MHIFPACSCHSSAVVSQTSAGSAGMWELFLFFSLPKTKLVTKVTSRHLLSTGTHGEQQVLAVLGTHGGMRDKSSEQMYSDVLKHRKGKGRVKFSDTSVLEDTCANLFLHFYFFFFLGERACCVWLCGWDSTWITTTAPIPQFLISSSLSVPCTQGLGTENLLCAWGRKGEKSILQQHSSKQVAEARVESPFISPIHYSFLWHTEDCQCALWNYFRKKPFIAGLLPLTLEWSAVQAMQEPFSSTEVKEWLPAEVPQEWERAGAVAQGRTSQQGSLICSCKTELGNEWSQLLLHLCHLKGFHFHGASQSSVALHSESDGSFPPSFGQVLLCPLGSPLQPAEICSISQL